MAVRFISPRNTLTTLSTSPVTSPATLPVRFLACDGLEGKFGVAANGGDETVGQGELRFGQAGLAATLDHVARAGPHALDVLVRYSGLASSGLPGTEPWGWRSISRVSGGGSVPGFQTSRRSANA